MTLEEAIKHCEEKAEELEKRVKPYQCESINKKLYEVNKKEWDSCIECAKEHRQLAEWLKELKYYKDRQDLINKNWQELIRYKEGIEKIKMRSQVYRERGETVLASGMEQALNILQEVNADERKTESKEIQKENKCS